MLPQDETDDPAAAFAQVVAVGGTYAVGGVGLEQLAGAGAVELDRLDPR